MDICYNIKSALKDKFYGVPSLLGWTRGQDARALAELSCGATYTRAMNGHHYWYIFIKDIENRDIVRFLLRRNGLVPEYHTSRYYGSPQPAFRMRAATIAKYNDLINFIKSVEGSYKEELQRDPDVLRYIDTTKTKLAESKKKTR